MTSDIPIKEIVRKIELFQTHIVYVWSRDNYTDVPSYAIVQQPPKRGGEEDSIK